jgi:Fe-S-cluster containining protein
LAKVGRNEPCPCGSGKKYKACCGFKIIETPEELAESRIRLMRETAYTGEIGRRRLEFCRGMYEKKRAQLAALAAKQQEMAAARSERITCAPGCVHCCTLLVGASIQEVELIVYYMYRHEDVFRHFMKTFPGYNEKMSETLSHPPSEWMGKPLVSARQRLYCPFLRDGACTIYEVRPLYCAGYISTSPPELCDRFNPERGRFKRNIFQTYDLKTDKDLSFYTGELSRPAWSFMPSMVFDVLQYGPEAMYRMKIFKV